MADCASEGSLPISRGATDGAARADAISMPPERRRVAVFCRAFLPLSQTFVYDAVTRLTRYRATVFCARRKHADQFPYEDVRIGWPGYLSTAITPNFLYAFARERFAVVHAQFGPSAVYALTYARLARRPLVVSFHGHDVPLLAQARRIRGPSRRYAWLGGPLLRRMALGLCASAELRDMLIAHGALPARLRVHRLGIDTQRFQPVARAHREGARVLMIGRLVEKKGFAYGLAAFAGVQRARSATLTIVGAGPLDERLRAQARELGVEGRTRFVGAVPHDQVPEIMRSHDVLMAPSTVARDGDRDSGLMVLREAAACGLVAIATRHGGLPDSVEDGVTGFLVAERDVGGMVKRLERACADAALRARMGAAARRKMEREFDISASMEALEAAYDDAQRLHGEGRLGRSP